MMHIVQILHIDPGDVFQVDLQIPVEQTPGGHHLRGNRWRRPGTEKKRVLGVNRAGLTVQLKNGVKSGEITIRSS